MDPSYFGLSEHPFDNPDEGDVDLLNEAHESLFTELRAGLKAPHGITLMIGDHGSGKTVLAKSLIGRLADTATVAYLPMTGPGLRHLLAEAIEQLGGDVAPSAEESGLIDTLKSIAAARAEHDRATVIVVDDAHELPAKTLERLNKLFGDDPAEPSMLHLILIGRQELLDRMNAAGDRTILKHLIQVCRMDPIGPEHSFRYIADRVSRVGGVVKEIFSPEALDKIITLANGVPYKIDQICSAALREAQERGDTAVDVEVVSRASAEVDGIAADDSDDESRSAFVLGELPVHTARNGLQDSYRGSSGPLSHWRELYENRRRLVLWGAGLVAVLAGAAALLTGTPGDEAGTRTTIETDRSANAPIRIASATKQPEPVGRAAQPALPSPLREPTSVPKMVVSRTATAVDSIGAGNTAAEAEGAARGIVAPPTHKAEFGRPSTGEAGVKPSERAIKPQPGPLTVAKLGKPAPAVNNNSASPQPPAIAAIMPSSRTSSAQSGFGAIVKPAPVPNTPQKIAAKAPSNAPTAIARPRVGTAVAPAGAAAKPAVAPTPVAVAAASKPAVAAPAKVGPYSVQIGAFGSRANAEKILQKHAEMFDDGRIVELKPEGKTIFRVISGGFGTRDAAMQREIVLKRSGFNTYVRYK